MGSMIAMLQIAIGFILFIMIAFVALFIGVMSKTRNEGINNNSKNVMNNHDINNNDYFNKQVKESNNYEDDGLYNKEEDDGPIKHL